jgi:hypothetical protein
MRRTLILIATIACATAARPLRAQVAADTGLAQAVASVIEQYILLGTHNQPTIVWQNSGAQLDSAVATILINDPLVRVRTEGLVTGDNFSIPRATTDGDSAIVTFDISRQYSMKTTGMNWYRDRSNFIFRRTPGGWLFIRREFVHHADGGAVRG